MMQSVDQISWLTQMLAPVGDIFKRHHQRVSSNMEVVRAKQLCRGVYTAYKIDLALRLKAWIR